MDKNLHLDSVIKTHQITKEEQLLNKHKEKNKEIKEVLEKNYGFLQHFKIIYRSV